MSQVSLIGFASGGAFLSLMHLDVIFYIMAIIVLTHATVREAQKSRLLQVPAAPAMSGMGALPSLRT